MSWLRTVGARLSLALLLVVAGVLAFVYLVVVPSLQNRLVDSRKAQVAQVASRAAERWKFKRPAEPDQFALGYASASNTRVTIFEVSSRTPLSLSDYADQGAGGELGGIANDPVARRRHRASSYSSRTRSKTRLEASRSSSTDY